MSKKVGIVTIHDFFNYGSVLQALATQDVIRGLGHDAQLIDYKYPNPRHVRGTRGARAKAKILKWGNSLLKDLLPGKPFSTYTERYGSFKRQYYRLSPSSYPTSESLAQAPPDYDVYVAGSDQIWRPKFIKDDPCFFLDFVRRGKKISYASSFGCTAIPDEFRPTYRDYLASFAHLGVREQVGAEIVRDLLGREATVVLDPTLLMTADEWAPYTAPYPIDGPYIACYGMMPGSTYMEELALHVSKLTGYRVVRINGKFYDYFNRKTWYILDAGPAEFLGLYANAAFILSQSFHGTVFAINFGRPFLSILKGEKDDDSRQRHILQLLGLEDRAIVRDSPFPTLAQLDLDGDTGPSMDKLRVERVRSIDFLKRALST